MFLLLPFLYRMQNMVYVPFSVLTVLVG